MSYDSYTFRQISFEKLEHASIAFNDVFKNNLYAFADAYTSNIIYDDYVATSSEVPWHCFECKQKIMVSAWNLMTDQKFDERKLFCQKHTPPLNNKTFKQNFVFKRYVVAFPDYLKKLIVKNSKAENLLQWKELQELESTFQSTPPESRSLFPNQKRTKKRLCTFKSVLMT